MGNISFKPLQIFTQLNSILIKDFNMKPEILKLPEEQLINILR